MPTPLDNAAPPSVKSADRVLSVLEYLASAGHATFADLARDLGIPKSSLHGLLSTMEARRWVERQGDRGQTYGLGLSALAVGTAYVDSDDVVALASSSLDWLSEQTGETTHLGRLDGADIVYLAKRESRHPLRLYSAIGRRLPAHATALGKALLAALPPAHLETLLIEPLTRLTPNTICSPADLFIELEDVRRRGVAVDNEENTPGIRCFAVSVTTRPDAAYAISCSVPLTRLGPAREDEIIDQLRSVQARLETYR